MEQVIEQKIPEQPAQPQEQVSNTTQQAVAQEAKPESDQEINWKKFKEARRVEREQAVIMAKKAAEKEQEVQALRAALEVAVSKPAPVEARYEDDSEEERISKRVDQILAKREEEGRRRRADEEKANLPAKLVKTYADFNVVCSAENLDYLEYHYPEVTSSFKYAPDGFDKWSDIYNAVKRFVPAGNTDRNTAKIERNLAKPQSASRPGMGKDSTSGPAIVLDDARKAANWERMQKTMRGGA